MIKNKREILEEVKNFGGWVEECVIIKNDIVRIILVRNDRGFRIRRDLEIKVELERMNEFLNG